MGQEEALATLRRENLALQDEEAALLDQAGYPPDALEETPLLSPVQRPGLAGRGHVRLPEGPVPPGADRGALLPAGPGGSVLRHLPPGLLRPADLAGVPPLSPGEHGVYPLSCRSYAENFDAYPHKNLFFNGPPGLGKTFLSACIARVVSEQGYAVVYDTAANILSRFETRKFARYGEESRRRRRTPAGISPVTC